MKVKVAVAQQASVFFNKEACIEKLEELAILSGKKGCQLIVFPESFIPGYPRGFTFGTNIGKRTRAGRSLYAEYYDNSVSLESEDRKRLEQISQVNDVYIIVGITEQMPENGSLYCSMLYISPDKGLMGVHRKIKPTGTERLIWAEAGGESLVTFDTKIGKLGGLICWENYMPLARMSMYQKGVEIYIAPTADSREEWTSAMIQIALEGRCFVIGCNQYFDQSMYSERFQDLLSDDGDATCRGGSIIVSPLGKIIEGPLYDKEGILIAELEMNKVIESKLDFDTNGHYSRPDIFDFKVNGQNETIKESKL